MVNDFCTIPTEAISHCLVDSLHGRYGLAFYNTWDSGEACYV